MLFKLSITAISEKAIQDYAVYFFTLVIGVAVFLSIQCDRNARRAMLEISTIEQERNNNSAYEQRNGRCQAFLYELILGLLIVLRQPVP